MITELFNIKYPIICGAMAMVSKAELTAAVSEEGGLGTLTSYGLSPQELQAEIKAVRRKTTKPFACNLMLQQENVAELLKVVIQEKVPIVSVSAGFNQDVINELRANQIKVIAVIGNVRQAKKALSAGVDCLVAEGCEAGGHIGDMTLATLLTEVLAIADIPVVAAGGITNHGEIKKYLQQRAAGVQLGTRFMLSQESPLPAASKAVLAKNEGQTEIISTKQKLKMRVTALDDQKIPCGEGITKIQQVVSVAAIFSELVEK